MTARVGARIFHIANGFRQYLDKAAATFGKCVCPVLEIKSFRIFVLGHSNLFRISDFGFRV
jgi:hypothetical protein